MGEPANTIQTCATCGFSRSVCCGSGRSDPTDPAGPNYCVDCCPEKETHRKQYEGLGSFFITDRLRVWNSTREFITQGEITAPVGRIYVVKVIDILDHPKPPRKKKR